MTEFMYVNPALINPKTGDNIREAEIAKLKKLRADGNVIVGLEVTDPELATFCDVNIDPQHTDGKADTCCAYEASKGDYAKQIRKKAFNGFYTRTISASENPNLYYEGGRYVDVIAGGSYGADDTMEFSSPAPEKPIVFITNRVDLDCLAAYQILDQILKNGQAIVKPEALDLIKTHDAHLREKWNGQKSIQEAFDPNNKAAALASSIKVFTWNEQNMEDVKNFLATGEVRDEVMDNYRTVQNGIIDRVKSGEIKTEVVNGVAYVETTLPCATNVGYSMAPVVVAVNPAMKLGPQGEPFRKISICQHEEGHIDMKAVLKELNDIQPGWGGSPTFIGSPQGENCNIPIEDVIKIVHKNQLPYLAIVRKNLAKKIDKIFKTNLEEKKLAKPLKKIEKAISNKLFDKRGR